MGWIRCCLGIFLVSMNLIYLSDLRGQSLSEKIGNIFRDVLELNLAGPPGTPHGDHFKPASQLASQTTIRALNNFIGTSISEFPLSSTVAGLTFDFSTGVPVSTSTSLGPIFAERAQTLGKGRVNIGYNFSFLNLAKLRGVNTENLRFTFTHQNVPPASGEPPGFLGDNINEFDTIDLFMDLDINATILAFYLTAGLTNRLDVGIAVPFVNISMKANPQAVLNSVTLTINDSANHFFGGTPENPQLSLFPEPLNDDATGIGDIAIRVKFNFLRGKKIALAVLGEYRPPTGDEDNFLGVGDATFKGMLVASAILGHFAPHVNLAFERRTSDFDQDEFEFTLGYDLKISEKLTFAAEFQSQFEIGHNIEAIQLAQKEFLYIFEDMETKEKIKEIREISLTNIPDFPNDDLLNAAFGLRYSSVKELIIYGNVFVPVNNGGLRSDFVPTLGFEFSL